MTHSTGRSGLAVTAKVEELCATLKATTAYRPRLDAVPFDRASEPVEVQRAQLLRHPEKSALAQLIAVGADTLEVSINFKACVDCHDFFNGSCLVGLD